MQCELLFNMLDFSIKPDNSVELSEFLFTDNPNIRRAFFNDKIVRAFGTLTAFHSIGQGYVFYSRPGEGLPQLPSEYDLREYVDMQSLNKISSLKLFLNCLWIVRDNSAKINTVVGVIKDTNWANFTNTQFMPTMASGDHYKSSFSAQELVAANTYYKQYNSLIKSHNDTSRINTPIHISENASVVQSVSKSNVSSFDHNKTNCLERAMHFLQMARVEDYLMYKIALYIPVLECLFITDSKDLMQKMRYRVAFYIGRDRQERRDIDDLVRDCYDIRSSFIHGQTMSSKNQKTQTQMLEYSVRLDELVRRIFRQIMDNDLDRFINVDKSERENYFQKLIYDIEGYPYRI